jgi:hypothetical protein
MKGGAGRSGGELHALILATVPVTAEWRGAQSISGPAACPLAQPAPKPDKKRLDSSLDSALFHRPELKGLANPYILVTLQGLLAPGIPKPSLRTFFFTQHALK